MKKGMQTVTPTDIVTIGSGIVGLTEEQYLKRAHNVSVLEKIEGDDGKAVGYICRPNKPLQFKTGEVFSWSEDPVHMNVRSQESETSESSADDLATIRRLEEALVESTQQIEDLQAKVAELEAAEKPARRGK